jgi:hypothetical protein
MWEDGEGGQEGPNYLGIQATEGKPCGLGNI